MTPLARSRRRGSRALAVAVVVVVAMVACEPATPEEPLYTEDFEELCEGTPCSWERVNGEPRQATWVETIHPGEHALRLEGDVTVRARADGGEVTPAVGALELVLAVAARCDPGSALRVDAVLAEEGGAQFTASTSLYVEESWAVTSADGWSADRYGYATRVIAVAITKSGPGACEIGDLLLARTVPEPGC